MSAGKVSTCRLGKSVQTTGITAMCGASGDRGRGARERRSDRGESTVPGAHRLGLSGRRHRYHDGADASV